jgi:uncharacterized integral membrane protein (TIGR02327 family)
MELRMQMTLSIFTYFALIPIVFRALMCIDTTKVFKKHRIGEIRLIYFLITIVITKIVGDFFIDIMDYLIKIMDL